MFGVAHYWNLILLLLAPYCVTVPQCSRETQTLGVSLALGLCASDISTGEQSAVGKHRRKVRNGSQEAGHPDITDHSVCHFISTWQQYFAGEIPQPPQPPPLPLRSWRAMIAKWIYVVGGGEGRGCEKCLVMSSNGSADDVVGGSAQHNKEKYHEAHPHHSLTKPRK